MSCTWVEKNLDAWLEGELPAAQLRRMEIHFAECPGCRRQAAARESLCRRAAALPRSIEPSRDLWPAISRSLPIPKPATMGEAGRRALQLRRWRWAAVFLVALVGTALGWAKWRLADPPGQPAVIEAAASTPQWVGELDAVFTRAQAALEQEAPHQAAQRGQLARTDVLEEQLGVLDEALRVIRRAIAEDPGNPRLGQALVTNYRKKLSLHRLAVRLGEERSNHEDLG